MSLNKKKTAFVISRIKNGIEEVAQYNDYNGSLYWYSATESATEFGDLELAKGMLQIQDMMAKLTKQDVTFKIYQLDSETFEIDNEGVRVVIEEPVEEPPVEAE